MAFLEKNLPAPRHAAGSRGACRAPRPFPGRAPSGSQPPGPRSRRQARAASLSCQGRGRAGGLPAARLPSRTPGRGCACPESAGGGRRVCVCEEKGREGGRKGVPPPRPPTPAPCPGGGFVLPGGRSRPAPLLLAWPRLPAPLLPFPPFPSLPFPQRRRRRRFLWRPFPCGWPPSPRAECLRAAGCSEPLGSFP